MTTTIAPESHAAPVSAPDASPQAEQLTMLRNSAADFVAGCADLKHLRELRGRLPGYDAAVFRQMAELGWFGILVPESHAGLGLGLPEMAVVLQELGKGLLAEPLVATVVLAGRVIEYGDNEPLKRDLLQRLAEGKLRPALAWQEQEGGLDALPRHTRVENTPAGPVLSGRKRFVAGAGEADGYVVTAIDGAQVGLYWVEAGAPGLQTSIEWRADGTPSTVVNLDRVQVHRDHVIGAPGAGSRDAVDRAVDEACIMASAEMLGVIEATLKMTLEYMRNRVQFGKPIGSFQALQHKAVDLYIQQELVRAVLGDAVQTVATGGDRLERSRIASRCKSRASDAGLRVTREAIQLHGAIGFTDEYDLGLYVKRALVLSAWLGNAAVHRRRFASLNTDDWQS